ncbi:thioesterase family protein [Nocardia aurantiaca]|uniref:Thioesterase family protein n=1 Tax=Nocardia aurantiaca TaxID=2675850 RepID=A0A6I3L8I2_9NOCA|nr:thioesterase family protein [Nocardia aurantiaca]MTE17064.1 thioesterase family protein [Nocardia aurantiaca]
MHDVTAVEQAASGDEAGIKAYYVAQGVGADGYERYSATGATVSVWAASMQHGAPPSALLARAVERCAAREGARVARLTMDILGPVPVGEVEVRAWVERPGKRVELVVAELVAAQADGTKRAVAKASAWRIATSDSSSVVHTVDAPLPTVPEASEIGWGVPDGWDVGYVKSVDIRPVENDGDTRRVWVKPRVEVVEGEEISPLVRVFSVADVANGIGAQLDPYQWTFLNTDLTIDLFRLPEGEWIGLAVQTSIGPDGIGMCSTVLHDEQGPIGHCLQILEVRARG